MRLLAAFLVVAAILDLGCGDTPPPPASGMGGTTIVNGTGGAPGGDPQLVGAWEARLNASCLAGATFEADASYALSTVCVLTDATLGLQTEQGTYAAVGDRIDFSAMKSTCADTTKLTYLGYAVTPSVLTLSNNTTVIAYTKAPTPTGGGAAKYGCFRAGVFTPMPLAALP